MLQAVPAASAEFEPVGQDPAQASRQPVAARWRDYLRPAREPSAAEAADGTGCVRGPGRRRRTADLQQRVRTATTFLRLDLSQVPSLPQRRWARRLTGAVDLWTTQARCPQGPQPQQQTQKRSLSPINLEARNSNGPADGHDCRQTTHRFLRGGFFPSRWQCNNQDPPTATFIAAICLRFSP